MDYKDMSLEELGALIKPGSGGGNRIVFTKEDFLEAVEEDLK